MLRKLPGKKARRSFMQLCIGKLARPVDGNEQVEFAFLRLHLNNIDMELADGVFFEFFLLRLIAFDLRQTGYAVAASGADWILSNEGWFAAKHKGSHPAAEAYNGGMSR